MGSSLDRSTGSSAERERHDDGPEPARVFEELGRYVVLDTLGEGGMGTVLRAYDRELDRQVALKVLRRDLDERHTIRLRREAQALAKLSHPNVVQVYEVGEVRGQTFVAMELVKGKTLGQWMRQEPRPGWQACTRMFLQLAAGLAAAHQQGLVHRDFKPGNAIIDDEGRPRVLDFGLVRQANEDEDEDEDEDEPHSVTQRARTLELDPVALDESITMAGAMLGTPAYMPFEQMIGTKADARSDQFSFCVALYEAIHGERPYEGTSAMAIMISMRRGTIRPAPRGCKVPSALRTVLLRGLAVDPEQRWPSMKALAEALEAVAQPRRTRRLVLGAAAAVALGLLGVGAGLGMESYVEWANRCADAQAHLDGIWDQARRQEVKAAILGTGISYAPDTWERLEPRLDAYVRDWVTKHEEVCEATRVRGEQTERVMSLRMGCLSTRRIALREAVNVLTQVEQTGIIGAMELVSGLPSMSRCDDVEALEAPLPPPDDPPVAKKVQELREELVVAHSLATMGDYEGGRSVAESVVKESEELGYAPLLAEALHKQAMNHAQSGRYDDSVRDMIRAYGLAAEHGHATVEADIAAHLVYVVGVLQGRSDSGLQWGLSALPLARSPGVEPQIEADALNNIGAVLASQGKLEEALDHHQRALPIWRRTLGPTHFLVARSLSNIGLTLYTQGDLAGALAHHQQALAIREQVLGPRHPQVAISWNHIGNTLYDQGKLEAALEHFRRALEIREQTLVPGHPANADSLDGIGNVLRDQGKLEEARDHYQRALVIRETALGATHVDVASSLVGLGDVSMLEGHTEAAIAHYERAVSTLESSTLSPARLAKARFGLARALWPDPQPDPQPAARARELARLAREAFIELEQPNEELARVEAWLDVHARPDERTP